MNTVCPTCGHDMMADHAPIQALLDAPMSRQQRAIVEVLADAYPGSARTGVIVDALWGDDPSGGPDACFDVLKAQMSNLRRVLQPYGWTVPSNRGGRGHYGAYRLQMLSEDRRR